MFPLFSLVAPLAIVGCEPPPPTESSVLTVVKEQTAAWVRNFNPLSVACRFPTQAGIYEPLLIYSPTAGTWFPWLAEAYEWRSNQVLALTIRDNVRWSDGEPFGVDDVSFTFDLILKKTELDTLGLSRIVDRIEVEEPRTVVLYLNRPFVPGLDTIAQTLIVPKHRFRDVPDLLRWTNPDPVGTGPFTEVRNFRSQVFELGRNPHYWQGPVRVEALRFPAIASNDQLAMALLQGEVDWAGAFVPEIDRLYVSRDPTHHKYWHPLGPSWFLYANTTRPPLGDVRVRKAISLALDRELMLQVSQWDKFVEPDRGTGLSDMFAPWRSTEVESQSDWVTYDPERAKALLDEAGFRVGPEGVRQHPDGAPLSLELSMVAGWSDTVRSSQVAATNLREVGLDVSVRSYDDGAWFANSFSGQFDMTLGWSNGGPSPYLFYQGLMATEMVKPVGTAHFTNWHRYSSPDLDALLEAFEATTDPAAQHALGVEMQRRFVEEAPAIPLFAGPVWGEFNTTRFVGWPTPQDPYAPPSPNPPHTPLLVLSRVRPRSTAEE